MSSEAELLRGGAGAGRFPPGVAHDVDGHGHIGEAQLAWLAAQLDDAVTSAVATVGVAHSRAHIVFGTESLWT